MAANSQQDQAKAHLARHLHKALVYLYDPTALGGNLLADLLGLEQDAERGAALRACLLKAIEALQPGQDTPRGVKSWRVYHILRRRYTEQMTQRQVAADLGLSKRQLQREEKAAREVLADYLWAAYGLDQRFPALEATSRATPRDAQVPTRAEELAWLRESVPAKMTDVREIIGSVLETLHPLQNAADVTIDYSAPDALPGVFLCPPFLRQALLDVLTWMVGQLPGGTILLDAHTTGRQLVIRAEAVPVAAAARENGHRAARENLGMAAQLVQLCGGKLRLEPQQGECGAALPVVSISFPIAEQTTVLVIDDNADALRLFEYYLAGTRYRFVGAQDAQRGLALAEELRPPVIVLDVMMPDQDGWSLLEQLREHPATQSSAVVVCTILAQDQLAWALGAADFIRKPVRREQFLAVLDHLLAPPPKEC
ncbi:MAG: response regulator [Chloroflexi bacterium]|jgi:CheY-like chemotaxis protein|nr:response regulator [Chloroflexota bacterium]